MRRFARTLSTIAVLAPAALSLPSCSDYRDAGEATAEREDRFREADRAVREFKDADASLKKFFESAYGYAVFPAITKGALGIGAAHGDEGVVYEQAKPIGWADVTQITIGAQAGGQSYAEIVFFEKKEDLDNFKRNNMEFSANASAVAVTAGAAATADYTEGVAVFTRPLGGLMFEASIGGQKFKFTPM